MIYQLTEFFQIIRVHHFLRPDARSADLTGRLTTMCESPRFRLTDLTRRALRRFIDKRA